MLANRFRGTLHIGTSIDLQDLVTQKKAQKAANPRIDMPTMLVWFENHADLGDAKRREEQIYRLSAELRMAMVERTNPQWQELEVPIVEKPKSMHRPTLRRQPVLARQFL